MTTRRLAFVKWGGAPLRNPQRTGRALGNFASVTNLTVVKCFYDKRTAYWEPRSGRGTAHLMVNGDNRSYFLFKVPTLFSAGRSPLLLAARPTAPAYEHACTHSALRHARARAPTRALAHTHAQERPTTTDATCGPPAWLTGSLHDRGIRSVRSPPRRAPLLATPIATPLQVGRPERPRLFVS